MLTGLKTSYFITGTLFPWRPQRFQDGSPPASRHGGQFSVPVRSMRVVFGEKTDITTRFTPSTSAFNSQHYSTHGADSDFIHLLATIYNLSS